MRLRYAILGVLLERPATGYEIKSLMGRSTVYFWRESDSTIYPILKVLAKEGKVLSEIAYVGKKKKEVFSITETGQEEFRAWADQRVMSLSAILKLPHTTTADINQDSSLKAFTSILILSDIMQFAVPIWSTIGPVR